jgi:hypothetical protein
VLVSCSDDEHVEGRRVNLAVKEPEALGAPLGGVELDACQAGEVAADVAGSEGFAGDPPVGEVVEDGLGSVEGVGVEGGRGRGWSGRSRWPGGR